MTCYINILDVYAFCNWHDVPWPLPKRPGAETIDASVIEIPRLSGDLDTEFEKVVKRALIPWKEPRSKYADPFAIWYQYSGFRTILLICWISSFPHIKKIVLMLGT